MSAWITVFCEEDTSTLSIEDVYDYLMSTDLFAEAEHFGIEDEELIEKALACFEQKKITSTALNEFVLTYEEEGQRQLHLQFYPEKTDVEEFVSEVTEEYKLSKKLKERLARTRSVFTIELSFSQLEDMGIVFAYETARHIASQYKGVIQSPDNKWFAVEDYIYEQMK